MLTPNTQSQPLESRTDRAPPPAPCADPRGKRLRWRAANAAWRWVRAAWYFVRQVSGDDAYERYRAHMLQAHADQPAMTRGEYYRFRTEQKWSRLTRCC
jgi:uncharacterized short protein YbdD (DUF466 family)